MMKEVQIHLQGVKQLLQISQSKGIALTQGIKRAIVW